jgi:hypothetical protein
MIYTSRIQIDNIIKDNFTKLFMILTDFLILIPILTKTPWWLFKNKKNIRIDNELYHRKKYTDKLLDIYVLYNPNNYYSKMATSI